MECIANSNCSLLICQFHNYATKIIETSVAKSPIKYVNIDEQIVHTDVQIMHVSLTMQFDYALRFLYDPSFFANTNYKISKRLLSIYILNV